MRHAVESIAIVVAGLWAAYIFIYQERIKPTLEAPSLQVTVTLAPGKTVSGTRIAELHVLLANTGHVDTDLYADAASVFGVVSRQRHRRRAQATAPPMLW